jgi:hypothetical protein
MNYARWKTLADRVVSGNPKPEDVQELDAAIRKDTAEILPTLNFEALHPSVDARPEVAMGIAGALKKVAKRDNLTLEDLGKITVFVGIGMIAAHKRLNTSSSN